jgi:hypothetical protein
MSEQIKDGGPAFPVSAMETHGTYGMTLRDYFAAKAFPAVLSAYVEANGRCIGTDHVAYNCASHAYRMADAMLAAREAKS